MTLILDRNRLGRINNWQSSYVNDRKYPGSSVLIHRGDDEVYFNACGSRNIEADLPFTRDTVARIYSMSKPITSVALMTLVERGLISLTTPLSDILPEFSQCRALVPDAQNCEQTIDCAAPTLQQVLTHSSGFSYGFNTGLLAGAMQDQKISFDGRGPDLADMVRKLAKLPLAFQPGTRWEYSVGIDVIGRVIEVVSGKSLGDYLRQEIFEPLNMSETGFSVAAGTGDRFAAMYTPLAGDPMDLNNVGSTTDADRLRLADAPDGSKHHCKQMHSGGGGLVGTIDDYIKFVNMLRRGGAANTHQILSPATLNFMMQNHLPDEIAAMGPTSFAEQPMHGMGFGIGGAVVLDPARAGTLGHIGDFSWGGMASTFFWVDRELDMSVVFFTQLSPSSSYPARGELKALVHGALMNGGAG
jgi:CubicO group peptidase (beta-lactamase class C family)